MTARTLLLAPLLVGCSLWGAPLPDPGCTHVAIDADAELLITDSWLRHDARATNRGGGNFSLAAQLAAHDAKAFWDIIGTVEPPAGSLPFRLLAFVNRTDLAEQLGPESPAGEARLVYTLTAGPADDGRTKALPLTVIVEYSLGSGRSAASWAQSFHQLAIASSAQRADTAAELVGAIINPATAEGAPYLSQIRVNDARGGESTLYELAPNENGGLTRRGLRNTPRAELAGTAPLAQLIHAQAEAVRSGTHHVPSSWLATSALVDNVAWLADDQDLAHAFARGTCGGCHGDEGPGQGGFHLEEAPDGSIVRSPFLTNEELPRREALMQQKLCDD